MGHENRRWVITSEKFLNEEQVVKLLLHVTQARDLALVRANSFQAIKNHYIIRTLLETGTRVFEFCALNNGDFSGQKLNIRRGKGNKPRTILLTKSTAGLLKEWLAIKERFGMSVDSAVPLFPSRYGTHYSTRGVQKIVKAVFRAAELPQNFSAHSLRHTYCSLLLASGKVSLPTVKENLGHHSIAVTNLYAHAIGSLDDVEFLPSSDNNEKSELRDSAKKQKPNDFLRALLRKANLK